MTEMASNGIKTCLVIVPHPDDEVILCGNTIIALSNAGVDVHVLFSTNGDWKTSAERRIKEAAASLGVLGNIPKENIILLGYSDNYNDEQHNHYYYFESGTRLSKAGNKATYGAYGLQDYSFWNRGEHSKYNRTDFTRDLTDVIESLKADILICVDFDEHPDHRMLTLAFDEAMHCILKRDEGYHPVILKGFAYCTSYTAEKDFFSSILKDTIRPEVGITGKYDFEMIDTSIYEWDRRCRILAPPDSRTGNLLKNRKAKALSKHRSQYAVLKAPRIINRDEVFWFRRSDSLSYIAHVSASDGDASCLNDFRLYNVNEIDSTVPDFCDYLWTPKDDKKEAVFEWDTGQDISMICLYGNIQTDSRINKVRIRFDNGFKIDAGPLPEHGKAFTIDFPKQKSIQKCRIKILEVIGEQYGLAECEFYEESESSEKLQWINSLAGEDVPVEVSIFDNVISWIYIKLVTADQFLHRAVSFLRRRGFRELIKRITRCSA